MAKKITLNIANDVKAVEIRDTIIDNYANPTYKDTIDDPDWVYDPNNPTMPGKVPNPVSRDAFFKAHIIDTIKSQYLRAKSLLVRRIPLESIENEDLELT